MCSNFQIKCEKLETKGTSYQSPKSKNSVDFPQNQQINNNDNFHNVTSLTQPTIERSFSQQVEMTNNLYGIAINYNSNPKVSKGAQVFDKEANIRPLTNLSDDPIVLKSNSKLEQIMSSNTSKYTPNLERINDKLHDTSPNINGIPTEFLRYTSRSTAAQKSISIQRKHMKIPQGVVPFQTNMDDIAVVDHVQQQENKSPIENVVEKAHENMALDNNIDNLKKLQNINGDSDTGTQEENDFVVEEHNNNDKVQSVLKDKNEMINIAAEVENIYDSDKQMQQKENKEDKINIGKSIDDLQVINQADIGDVDNRILLNGNKLKSEVNEDQGKAYPEEINYQAEDEDGKLFNDLKKT